MSTEQYLNKLFETARHAAPLLSEEDIELQLKAKGIHTPKRFKLFNLKTVFIMSILIVLFSSLFFWLPLHKNEEVLKPAQQIEKLTDKKTIAEPILTAENVKKATNFVAAKPVATNAHINPFASSDPQLFPTQFSIAFTEPKVDQEGETPYLILTNEELRGLHIFTDGNVLEFSNTKNPDAKKVSRENNAINMYYIHIGFEGSCSTISSVVPGKNLQDSLLLNVRPVMVEKVIRSLTGKRQEYHKIGETITDICDPDGILSQRANFINWVQNNLVPVKVSLTAKESIYGSKSFDVIFWYKPTLDFINILSAEKQEWVKSNFPFDANKVEAQLLILQEERNRFNKSVEIDSITRQKLFQQKIILSNPELKMLGFVSDNKTIKYANKYDEKKYLQLNLNNEFYISVSHSDRISLFKRRKFTKLNFYPVFATDLKLLNIDMFMPHKDLPEDIKELNRQDQTKHYFYNMHEKLIPVQINLPQAKPNPITKIFWFEPTPDFLAALPKDKLQLVKAESKLPEIIDRSIDLRNIKVIELTNEELDKFGIIIREKSIIVKTIVNNKSSFDITYSKEGTSFQFDLNTFKMDSGSSGVFINFTDTALASKLPSISVNKLTLRQDEKVNQNENKQEYPAAKLITDDLGKDWRTYEVEDGLTDDDKAFMKQNNLNQTTWEKAINARNEAEQKLISKIGEYIPILVKSGDVNLPDDAKNNLVRADIIIWYEPTELLFNTLPPRIANELRAEYQSIFVQKESNGANCKFFEACKNKPGAIVSYNIFPNPTEDDLQIEFTLSSARTISANLYTVNGQLVKSILNQKAFESGSNKYATHINDLAPGIYLLVIESDKGEMISQRIVRK